MTPSGTKPIPPAFEPAIKHLEETLRGIRAGRATPGLVEHLEVDVYGSRMALQTLARIGVADQRTILVEPWDRQQMKIIEKAIASSPLGVNPVTAGSVIRIPLPPLTEERRRELTKLVRRHMEETRIAIRGIREKNLRALRAKKDSGEMSEDAFERARKALQSETDEAWSAAEELGKAKETEILSGT